MLALSLMLSGCDLRTKQMLNSGASSKLPYKVATASDPAIMKMPKQLSQNGVKVITMGQDYLITIPSTLLFASESPRVKWDSYPLLNDVACFLRQFRKININITSYSGKCGSPQRERALTLARARAVGDYLWSQDIDSRFIFTQGLGSDKPIVGNNQGGDKQLSSRIEITFRDAVA